MNWFAIVSLTAALICLALGITVYLFNRKALLNKLFFLTILSGFIYEFTTVMMRISPDMPTAFTWHKMGTEWPFFTALVLNFALVYTKNRWIQNKWNYLILYLPAAAFWLTDLCTFQINAEPELKYWGYNDIISGTPVYFISAVWTALLPVLAFILCLRYYKKATDPTTRLQAKYVTAGFAIPISTYIVTNVLTRSLHVDLPNLGISATLFFSVLVGYAIVKYELFTLDKTLSSEHIIAAIPDSFALLDNNAQIQRVNDQFENVFGYSENELKTKSLAVIFAENQQSTFNSILNELTDKNVLTNYEAQVKTNAGEIKHVLFSGAIVRNKKGKPVGITCIMKDITSRIEMETKILKSERLASIGELAGQIGHDLRNPLAAIKSSVYLFKKKNGIMSEDERRKIYEWIETAIDDSDRIINSLVEYSADLQLQLEKCTPKSLTAKALSKLKVPSRIKIVDLTIDEPELFVDAQKMETVFFNLIQNAVDAIPDQGTITIAAAVKGDQVEVSFADSGVGISELVLPKIFSPLVTTKAKGMGMSLAICKRVVDAHGGKISFETEKNVGSKFTVTLPIKLWLTLKIKEP
jgi:PAS domain S-box-containing protein